jgi:hypothetical protein
MKILLQPSSGKKAMDHFNDTIENGVPISVLKGKISQEEYSMLKELKRGKVKTWGFAPSSDGTRKEWEKIGKGDWSLFYAKKGFFYLSKIFLKTHNKELAEHLWGFDEKGKTWEYVYFIEEGKQIEIPYNPEIIDKIDGNPYSSKHILQGALLLDGNNALKMKEYIESFGGEIVEEDINPSEEDDIETEELSRKINTPEEAERILKELTLKIENEPRKQIVRKAKSWVRNGKISRLIKERVMYKCEICGEKPFRQKNGNLYAETHHVLELAKSGLDLPKNMICVCPICHRILHYGSKESFEKRKSLKNKRI